MKKIKMLINADDVIGHINPELYGHFAEHLGRCIYNGIYVGENSDIPNTHGIRNDIIEAFRNIKVPVLRWPGGCFADYYHWMDGIGEKSKRKKMINTNWGGVVEDNSFGTHEFMELCELVGCEPYITGNVGSGTVQEMADWIEYMTFDGESPMTELRKKNGREKPWKLKYFGVGNESWGCGGNMRPDDYVFEYRKYQGYCRNYGGSQLYKIACGPTTSDWEWTETMMKNLTPEMTNAIDLHYYTMPIWPAMDSATEFNDEEYYDTIGASVFCDEVIRKHSTIMDRYDPDCKIDLIIGEWGCWHDVEKGTNPGFLYQQNTMRDAMVAAYHLNIFNRHSKRLKMANLAQVVNVLQSVILTEGEKLVKTPTYHVFDLFKNHQDGEAVYCHIQNENVYEGKNTPMISSSVSIRNGVMTITLANCSLSDEAEISCNICGFEGKTASGRIISGDAHDLNDFDNPENVVIKKFGGAKIENGVLKVALPTCSVVEIVLK